MSSAFDGIRQQIRELRREMESARSGSSCGHNDSRPRRCNDDELRRELELLQDELDCLRRELREWREEQREFCELVGELTRLRFEAARSCGCGPASQPPPYPPFPPYPPYPPFPPFPPYPPYPPFPPQPCAPLAPPCEPSGGYTPPSSSSSSSSSAPSSSSSSSAPSSSSSSSAPSSSSSSSAPGSSSSSSSGPCVEVLGQPSATYQVKRIDLFPDQTLGRHTRGTGIHSIDQRQNGKLLVNSNIVPVQSSANLTFSDIQGLSYQALLYELRGQDGMASRIVPNWFGVATPDPEEFDLSSDVYVVIYFHPTPAQAQYNDADYYAKNGNNGTDWKQLFAYVDRLGGQMAGSIRYESAANKVAIFPFLTQAQYTLPTREWGNIIHAILQDINATLIPGICTRPKKVIVATLSNGSVYLNRFLAEASSDGQSIFSQIIEVWDFDSVITTPQVLVKPHGKHLRAYWQAPRGASIPASADFVQLPASSWTNFPNPPKVEVPPLPPTAPNTSNVVRFHHYIRDTMFLDAVWNLDNSSS
jgi:hypothetical protein